MIENYKIVGIFLSDIRDEFRSRYVQRICDEAEVNGYRVIVYNSFPARPEEDQTGAELYASYQLIDFDRIDAMIVLTLSLKNDEIKSSVIRRCREKSIPVILMDEAAEGCYSIQNRLDETFEKLVRHVIVKHHVKNVVMVSGPEGNLFAGGREKIFLKVVNEYCLPVMPDTLCHSCDMAETGTKQIVDDLLRSRRRPPEAIVCANDLMAYAVIERLGEYGYRVPEDVIVTGVDGAVSASYYNSSLTTCRLMVDKDADETIAVLKDLFIGKTTEHRRIIPHELVLGASCGCGKDTVSYFGRNAEQIFIKYKNNAEMEDRTYQLMVSVMRDGAYERLAEKLKKCITRPGLVAINADGGERKRMIQHSCDVQSYPDQMTELCGRKRSGECSTGRTYPVHDIYPDMEVQIIAREPIIVTPLNFDDHLYGYYVTHYGNIMDHAEEIFWADRMIAMALAAAIDRYK